MGVGNLLVLAQCTTYILLLLLSLLILVPLDIQQQSLGGHCLLFAHGESVNATHYHVTHWGASSYCNYIILLGVFSLVASLAQAWRMGVFLYKDFDSTPLSAFIDVVVSATISILLIIGCLMLSIGFNKFCDKIKTTLHFHSCNDAMLGYELMSLHKNHSYEAYSLYTQLSIAEFSTWSSWLLWSLCLSLCMAKVCRFHRQEEFLASMAREKERLLQRVTAPRSLQI